METNSIPSQVRGEFLDILLEYPDLYWQAMTATSIDELPDITRDFYNCSNGVFEEWVEGSEIGEEPVNANRQVN